MFEFSPLNTDCFQVLLNLVAQQFKDDLLIIQLDDGEFDKAIAIKGYSIAIVVSTASFARINRIEQVWQYLKRRLRWSLRATVD